MSNKPNIVLIQADQWRGDCLSIAGHTAVHTPALDGMALDGARFTRAYSATPVCIPARAALMTGFSQRQHGRVGYADGVPWNYSTTLAGEFARHGYHTQAVGKMHVYPKRSLIGFHNVVLHDGYGLHWRRRSHNQPNDDDYLLWLREQTGDPCIDDFDHGVHCNSNVTRPWPLEERFHPTNWVASQGADFLRRRDPTKPFFLYLSFHRPHPPYDPPAWALDQMLAADLPEPPKGDWVEDWADLRDPFRADTPRGPIRDDLRRRAQAGYYGQITHIDHQINRFLYALREYGLDESTWVCFTSDHGEMLGDHHLYRKSVPYEGSSHVPLILRPPADSGLLPSGSESNAVAEQRDVMPSLLEAAGLPIPEGIDGKSLLACARGEADSVRKDLHGELVFSDQSIQWMTDGRYKYIWRSGDGIEQLFDLQEDPKELRDLVRTGAVEDKLVFWRSRLCEELAGREEGFVDGGQLVTGRQVVNTLNLDQE